MGLAMFRLLRIGRRTTGGAMLVASFIAFLFSNQFAVLKLAFNFWDPFSISQYRLSHLSDDEYKAAIEQTLEEGDISEAQALVEIARENGRELPAELLQRTQENLFEFGLRNAGNFINGAVTGEISNTASLGGVLAADYVGVGDVRDVAIQGNLLIRGENYDGITLAFSLVGVTTSAVIWGSSAITVATGGTGTVVTGPALAAATVADTGASIIKNANKIGKLSQPLAKHIARISANLIDVDGLKRGLSHVSLPSFRLPPATSIRNYFGDINWQQVAKGDFAQLRKPIAEMMPIDIGGAEKALRGAIRGDEIENAKILAMSVSGVVSNGGTKAAFRAIEHADDAKELSRFQSLAARMGEKTSAVIKVLGKNAIKLGKLLYLIITILIAVLGWILGALWFSYSIIRTTYRAAKRVTAIT